MDHLKLVTVFTGRLESAKVVQALLTSEGFLASLTQDFAIGSDAAADSGFFGSFGVGVQVPEHEAEAASRFLAERREAGEEIDESEVEPGSPPA